MAAITKAELAAQVRRLRKSLERAKAKNAALGKSHAESLEQQTATSEILRVISSSPGELGPTFQTILASATRFCAAHLGLLYRYDGNAWTAVAFHGADPAFVDFLSKGPIRPGPKTALARLVVERRPIHITDILADEAYEERDPLRVAQAELGKGRTLVAVPMHQENQLLGALVIYRPQVRPFTEGQIDLVRTFADQAALAMENVRLFHETKEALERQTATAEILRVISGSPTDVQPVFDAIVEHAMQLIGGHSAAVTRIVEDTLHLAAFTTTSASGDEALKSWFPMPSSRGIHGKAIRACAPAYVVDTETEPDPDLSGLRELARAREFRSNVVTPMIREGVVIGTISVTRREPGPFTDHQINLLKTFADQAVIAIENVRLFNETKEALERQTATAEILRVISSSPTDVQPVFDTIARNAVALCGGLFANVFRYDGKLLHYAASHHVAPEQVAMVKQGFPRPPDRGRVAGRAILSKSVACIEDALADPDYDRPVAAAAGWRRMFAAPMLREGEPLGAIAVGWAEPGPIPTVQEELLKTFADQAAIAIENVRLFNETKEALERQTATAEILKVISSSPTQVQPVFEAIADSSMRLLGGWSVHVCTFDGERLHFGAARGALPDSEQYVRQRYPAPPNPDWMTGRCIIGRTAINISDCQADPSPAQREFARQRGYRAALAVPMLRHGQPIGAIAVTRETAGAFAHTEVDMLQTFADQAVIAIENVRLFKELEARTEALSRSVGQLTALGEVGQAISSTLDLETVLRTIVSRALQLTRLDAGEIFEYDERTEEFHLRAAENLDEEIVEALRKTPMRKGEGAVGRTGVTGEPTVIPEILDASYQSRVRELLVGSGHRALLAVPLLREDRLIGALVVNRKSPGPFAPETVELLKTFATQSAMAIQNARLFREIAEKSRQLETASQHKSQFLASMSHELRTPLNAILGFNEMILGQVYGEVPADMKEPLEDIQKSGKHLLRLINNVLDLAKIEAGRMELALADYSVQDTVESVRTQLRPLAADKGLEFAVSVADEIPLAYGDAGRITQCLVNLAGNSLKFTKSGRVEISVGHQDGLLTYCVSDTGIGIPPDKIGSLFTEFKQTDATIASEYGGTGLGLSIARKFIEMHGGRIWVESEVGQGSRFIFEVPLRVGEKTVAEVRA